MKKFLSSPAFWRGAVSIVVFLVLWEIAILRNFFLFVLIVFVIIHVFGDDVQVNGMDLRDL